MTLFRGVGQLYPEKYVSPIAPAPKEPQWTTVYNREYGTSTWADLRLDNRTQVRVNFKGGTCCGLYEMHSFFFAKEREVPLEVGKRWLKEVIDSTGAYSRKGIIHLTLTRYTFTPAGGERKHHQPDWFIEAVETYPGGVAGPWIVNPNSGNEIKMFMLPWEDRP